MELTGSGLDGLHSRNHNEEVQFYAFDMLVSDGDDIRKLPLSMRKANPSPIGSPGRSDHACMLGLEGLAFKYRDRPYRAGRSPHWVKVKNPASPAMNRTKDAFS